LVSPRWNPQKAERRQMILRRVIAHFRKQEWTAIAIDFIIVVVGVFVGLQVNNWNEGRANNSIAAGHLEEIADDLRSHLDFHNSLYGSAVARVAAVDYIYGKAFNKTLPKTVKLSTLEWTAPPNEPFSDDELDHIMGAVNLIRVTVSARNGYESLISSGHLGLVKNAALARSIQQFYGRYDDLLNTGEVFRTFRNDGVRDLYRIGVSVFDERPVEEIVALAREDQAFAAYLRSTREWAIVHAGLLENLRAEAEALLAEINAEISRLE
jgi:hypothetical protein